MPPTRSLIAAALALGAVVAPVTPSAQAAGSGPVLLAQAASPATTPPTAPLTRRPEEMQADPMLAYDIDKNGTLSLAEIKSAAAARFDELNPDQDDSLDEREAAPVLQGVTFRQADGDGDGKISKAEYLAYVERTFLLANPDKDGTLDRAELGSEAGQALVRLLR